MKNTLTFILSAVIIITVSCSKKTPVRSNDSREKLYAKLSREIENGSATTSTDGLNYNNAQEDMGIKSPAIDSSETKEILIDPVLYKSGNSIDRINEIKQDTIPSSGAGPKVSNKMADLGFGLSITGMVFSLIPMVATSAIAGFLFLIGFAIGIVALNQMSKEPNKYKGKGKAIFSVVLGALLLLAILVAVFSL